MLNSALIPEHEINKENVISQDYNLLSDNNPNVIWNGNKVQLRRPNGLSNPTKLKFRSFQTELLPYTSLGLPKLKTELYLTTSTNADSVKVGGKYNRFGIGPLLKTEYKTSDNKSEVLDSFTKAWTYNADYDSQIEYNIKECIDYANIRLNEWIEKVETGYIYKDYDNYLLKEYINENIGTLPKYNYSDSICSIVGDKVAIATYNNTTNKLDVNLTTHFNRVSNCSIICASSNRELIYAVGALDNNLYSFSMCYYLRNSDKKYIQFLGFHWGWNSETFLMPITTIGCTMSRNYSLINSANSSGEGWERGNFCLMYHGDINDNPPVVYRFNNSVIAQFSNDEVVCVAIAETISTLPGNFYALFANYNTTTKKVDLYLGQVRIGGDNTISYIPSATGTMELDYWKGNKFMECAMGMDFDAELITVSLPNDGTLYNFSNKLILKVNNGEILDVYRYYNYSFYNYQDPDNKYCLFGGLAGPGTDTDLYMVKESELDTETLYNEGDYNRILLISHSVKPFYAFGSNSGFVQTDKEDGIMETGGLKGKAIYTIYENLINLRDGEYVEGEQTYTLANQDFNHATAPEEELINMSDTGGQKNIIHPQLLFGVDKVANIGLRIYTEPYYFEVFHDDNYYTSPLYSLYPVSDIMKIHFINSHVYNTLETIILMQYEYNDLMLRVNQFPNNDNVVFSSGDIARVAFKTMDINTTTEFLNCELATNNEDAITKEDLKRIYGKVSVSCDWIQ